MTATIDDAGDDSTDAPENLDGWYADLTTDDGSVVIYDVDDHSAWVQSDTAIRLPSVV